MIASFESYKPKIHPSCFVAPSADVLGQVQLEEGASVWFQAVLRGDNDTITVGRDSNIQDGVIIHVDPGYPCTIGERSVIGHKAVLHGCSIGHEVLIGIGAIVLNGAKIPDGCLVGAGALVSENKELESGYLYMGVPARKVRELRPEEREGILRNAAGYRSRAERYRETSSPVADQTET